MIAFLFSTLFSFFFTADNDATVDEHHGYRYQYQQCSTYIREFYTSIYSPAEEEAAKSMEPPSNPSGMCAVGSCVSAYT